MEYEYARKLSLTRIMAFNIWVVLVTLLFLYFLDGTSVEHWAVQLGFTFAILMPILIFDFSQMGAHWLIWRYKIPIQQAVAAKDLLVKNEEEQLTHKPFWAVFLSSFLVFIIMILILRHWLPAYQKRLDFLFQGLIYPFWLLNCFYINKHFWIQKQINKAK